MPCPRCGAISAPDQRFCKNCGAPLLAPTPEPAPAPAPNAVVAPAVQPTALAPPPTTTPVHPIPDGGLTMEEVVAWLESGGYSAKVVTADNGKRHILSNSGGHPFNIFTPGCLSGRCVSLEFVAAFIVDGKFDVSKLNEWNGSFLWCRSYYDSAVGPCLTMDIALWPGGTFESLNSQFAAWNERHEKFLRFLR